MNFNAKILSDSLGLKVSLKFIDCFGYDNPIYHIYPCRLIRICTVRFLVRNKAINKKAYCADPDKMAQMCQLIRIYTVCPCNKGLSME
jgi:hypothetical protein